MTGTKWLIQLMIHNILPPWDTHLTIHSHCPFSNSDVIVGIMTVHPPEDEVAESAFRWFRQRCAQSPLEHARPGHDATFRWCQSSIWHARNADCPLWWPSHILSVFVSASPNVLAAGVLSITRSSSASRDVEELEGDISSSIWAPGYIQKWYLHAGRQP